MYKCLECGHIFEEGEQATWRESHGFTDGLYEEFSGCPLCHGEYDPTIPCKHCRSEHTQDELSAGWCEECLIDQINYGSFLAYFDETNGGRHLDEFVMMYLLGGMECPEFVSKEFHDLMRCTYCQAVAQAKMHPETEDFLSDCVEFIMGDSISMELFGQWLGGKEVKS